MATRLREAGIQISSLVRAAIRAAHERHASGRTARRRPSAIMADIYRENPDPKGTAHRPRDLGDRRVVRRIIRQRLRRRRK